MSIIEKKPYECLKNPHIIELCRRLERLPEWLAEQERKRLEAIAFADKVFGEAVRKSGLLERLGKNKIQGV